MRYNTIILLCSVLLGCGQKTPVTPQQRPPSTTSEVAAANTTVAAQVSEAQFYALNNAAKASFAAGKHEEAKKYAHEVIALLPQFQGTWNYGNAMQDANLVLGRIAVREGSIADAKRHLVEAGKSPGSPQMDTFGPNMSLAKDLLEKGEQQVVLEYFEQCRKFWELERGRLDTWSQQVREGKTPNFKGNLHY